MRSFFKKTFVAGALVLIPLAVTLWVFKVLIVWSDDFIKAFVPGEIKTLSLFGYEIPGLGLLLTLNLIFLTGILTRLYIGKKLFAVGDRILHRIPLGNSIYRGIQQFMTAVITPTQEKPREVVLVEYPRKGSYMIGFVTGESGPIFREKLGQKMVHVFIPTAPNPTSGFLVLAPRENVIPIDISPEQAFKLVISGGTLSA